jgi:hypothetical protein
MPLLDHFHRPLRRQAKEEIEIWPATFTLGETLPSLPLFMGPELSLVVDFEASYQETWRRLRVGE